jgi:hypothetical protein
MSHWKLRGAAVAAALALAAPSHAGDGVQVSTVCVAGSGEATLSYAGVWRDSCIPRNPSVQVIGHRIELHATSVGEFCLAVLTPYTISATARGLCDGVYETVAVIHLSSGAEHSRVIGPMTAIDCSVADFNNDCAVGIQDVFDFLAAYFASNPRADVNHSGGVTVQDVFDFLAAYFAG